MSPTGNERGAVAIATADGLSLHATLWPCPDPRGVLVIAHGLGEHGGCYDEVARVLGERAGLEVLAPDLRGHGRSPGRRGVVRVYNELTADFLAAFAWAGTQRPGLPRYVLGHSNGGQVALHAALDPAHGPQVAGLVLSNPALRVAARVPGYKIALGRLLLRYAPGVTLGAQIDATQMTHDPAKQLEHTNDPLRHSRVCAPLFFGMVEGVKTLNDRTAEVRQPVLFLIGGSDPVIDPEYNAAYFERLGSADKTLKVYPGMVHEPLNELDRAGVHDDLVAWFDSHLRAGGRAAPQHHVA